MDEIRAARGGDLGDMLRHNLAAQAASSANTIPDEAIRNMAAEPGINWVQGGPVYAVPDTRPETIKAAFASLNALTDEFTMYRDRVAELDQRNAVTARERDAALAKAGEYNIDRHSEQKRADELQRQVTFFRDARRQALEDLGRVAQERDSALAQTESRGHVCVERCRPNAHVAFKGREEMDDLLKVNTELRAALNLAREERDERFTSRQVGDLQASEAELVAAPLRKSLAVARDRVALLERSLSVEMASNSALTNQAADELAARRECERQVHAAQERVQELVTWLDRRQVCQRRAESEAAGLRVALDRVRPIITKISDAVAAEAVGQAIDPENPDYDTEPSRATLRDLARQIRHEVRKLRPMPGTSVSTWDGPTCGEQCQHEGSPGSPTE